MTDERNPAWNAERYPELHKGCIVDPETMVCKVHRSGELLPANAIL